ncbi:Transmembrane protein 65 [Seminavis robusta]|uniref:Transmembrane protein 65 n=1 Tax=Seminavis robusta TaxID=568900 RepID=A0A9N8E4R7_9STRA|nr:Transmembrane protein 65 [Seminavis robusta]|eukprot:Sro650_g181390.1 Transmembrane protein 65 (380) ;mRNA; f:28115-29254
MHPAARSVSRRGLMLLLPQQSNRMAVLVVSRSFSRRITASHRPTNMRNISTRKTTTSSSNNSKQHQPLHSSATTQQSTLSIEQAAAKKQQQALAESTPTAPTMDQLKVLFTASAIPMIGFGVMDNLVMIQAGQFIDSTLGVTMGLATMSAAAAGQVVSDVSGVIFGGSLERFLHRYKLIQPSNLTVAQRSLPICRNVALLGAVIGVAFGCALGASCLLFMDLAARERAERAIQLQGVLNDMMMAAGDLQCESCIIHLANMPAIEKQFSTTQQETGKTRIKVLTSTQQTQTETPSLAQRAAETGSSLTNDDNSILCTPIMTYSENDNENENNNTEKQENVVAVLEFHTKADAIHGFTEADKKAAKVMARHIAIFMNRLSD